jgi:hypothetical protein
MYLVFRSIQGRRFGPDEAVLNGLEAVKSASIGRLDETRRRSTLALLDETGAEGPIVDHVRAVLHDVPALPPHQPGSFERFGMAVRARYHTLTEKPGFARFVSVLMVIVALLKVATVVLLALDHSAIRGFSEWASVVSSMVAGVLIVIGALRLHHSRVEGYVWFERGLLVEILVTQVFLFAQEQLAGIADLAITIVLWLMVRSALRAEREREILAGVDPSSSHHRHGSASPAPDPVP